MKRRRFLSIAAGAALATSALAQRKHVASPRVALVLGGGGCRGYGHVGVIRALPGLPIVIKDSLCGKDDAILDFLTGNAGTAGWETYYIDSTSTTEVRALWEALPFCSGQPIVDIGFCGNIANGVNATIVNEHLKPMFKANPNDCYLIPVVAQGGNFNQCRTITDWAQFCPDKKDAFPGGQGKLKGKVTCGQDTATSRDTKCYVPFLVRDTKSGM